jgi:glycosyltransferase involved in cell wall biosynthesis
VKTSVVLIAYNGQSYIQDQIYSILEQIGSEDELIVSDDCSTDTTALLVESINDPRIVFVQNPKRLGIVKNFEKAAMLAQGDFVFFSDQDDIWLPTKFTTSLKYLQNYDLVISDCIVWDSQNDKILGRCFDINPSSQGLFDAIMMRSNFLGCCMACRREVLTLTLPFSSLIESHDTWIGLVSHLFFRVHHINKPLLIYRRHNTNASHFRYSSRPLKFKILTRLKGWLALSTIFYRYFFKKKRYASSKQNQTSVQSNEVLVIPSNQR